MKWVAGFCMAAALVACGAPKGEVTEDFRDLASLDEKSDAFSWRMKIVGSLNYGETSVKVKYKNPPRFRAFKFAGQKGDKVKVSVRSTNGGDAIAWVTNNAYDVLASNDDFGGSLDSFMALELPGNSNPAIVTYYVIFRDYWLDNATFRVELQGEPATPPDFYSCRLDSDCTMVQTGCCAYQGFTAVNAAQASAYTASLGCQTPTICPAIAIRPELRVTQCNNSTNKCELVRPQDIACGGRVASGNAHDCPAGWQCYGTKRWVDGTDVCVQSCGGIAARPCSNPAQSCQDDAYDDCDPNNGGADCGGVCLDAPAPADCRTTGCATGRNCQLCWTNWACIPDGAIC